MDSIIQALQKMGFSQYEAKAYIGLLKQSPVTGYELSKISGVPRSMIYEVLGKLRDMRAAYTVPSEPVRYSPVPAEELTERLRRETFSTLDRLEADLQSLEIPAEVDCIWRVGGREAVENELLHMVERADSELWLSLWRPQIDGIRSADDQALERGVDVFSILFGEKDEVKLGETFHHDYMTADVVKERMGGRLMIAVRDRAEVLIANFPDDSAPWAVKTKDPALVLVATEYVRHDLMIEAIVREFGADRLDALWRNNPALVRVVTGKGVREKQTREEGSD